MGKPIATAAEILAHFDGKIAKWQIPDDVVFVDSIALGATGGFAAVARAARRGGGGGRAAGVVHTSVSLVEAIPASRVVDDSSAMRLASP